MRGVDRRLFLQSAAGDTAAPAVSGRAFGAGAPKKAVLISMLPRELPYLDRFKLAVDAGFAGIEMRTVADAKEADAIKEASARSGLRIHSVMNAEHWNSPLSSEDRAVVDKSVAGMETSLRNAKLWGADAVLLVPAVVNPQTSYKDAWTRSQKVIRERILPLAQELKVVVAVEEVWNKFLLSPLEFAQYVDEFDSPWLKAYFDVGNVVFYGYPQDWIRALGSRTVKVHLKDFQLDRGAGRFHWKNLGEGDIDWPEVRKALSDVSYDGWVTTEIAGGDAAYLKDVVARLDRFLAGHKPHAGSPVAAAAPGGWIALFDGSSTDAWRAYNEDAFPASSWKVEDGILKSIAGVKGARDMMTREKFKDFELELEYRLAPAGNSGIIYRVAELAKTPSWHTGPEMQLIDDVGHANVKPLNSTGALYDLIAPLGKTLKPAGEWNSAGLVVRGFHVEHWLNGKKVVEAELDSPQVRSLIAQSKFRDMARFGKEPEGHIVLQYHGDEVAFRNVRVRPVS
jgi:hexulose-6-phosphate isomerase